MSEEFEKYIYEPGRNQTVDSNYHVIGNGNLLTTLL